MEPIKLSRNRFVMLNRVENFWIKGVLQKSLHSQALLQLGIKDELGAAGFPWTITIEPKGQTLPASKSMLEIFQEVGKGCSLLILGAPGSGKTIMLLELTRQLIERARMDGAEPMPLVFNLASWMKTQTLTEWLAEQLIVVYHVTKESTSWWLKNKKWVALFLLDGLDEVKAENRAKCIEAINLFRREHDLVPLVVCSHSEEYSAANARLALEGVITIEPLTSQQVNTYLAGFGNSLTELKSLLKKDKALRELAKTPLLLSMMILAYKDRIAKEWIAVDDLEKQRKRLFDEYIAHRFEQLTRTTAPTFLKPEILHYLTRLARRMLRHDIVTYQIETMQFSWLNEQQQQQLYRFFVGLMSGLVGGLISGLVGGLLVGLLGVLMGMPIDSLMDRLLVGLIGWLIGGLLIGLMGGLKNGSITDRLKWSWENDPPRHELSPRLMVLLITALFIMVGVCGLGKGLIGVLIIGLLGGLTGLLLGRLSNKLMEGMAVEQVPKTTAPQERRKELLSNLLTSTVSGALVGVVTGDVGAGIRDGLDEGLSIEMTSQDVEKKISPIQRLRETLTHALVSTLLGGLAVGMMLLIGLRTNLSDGLTIELTAGLMVGLMIGFFPLMQYYLLRSVLAWHKVLPWRLIPFLEQSVDLSFLQRVGGSYIFIHRSLMEHFAEMEV